jgi:predicted ATPase
MLNQISFRNYKIFKDRQTIKLKPITILIGKNNTGKSAVLKLMSFLEGALNGEMKLNNDGVVIGNEFKDLIHGKFSRSLELEVFQKFEDKETYLKTNVAVDSNKDKPILENWNLKETDENDVLVDKINLGKVEGSVYRNEIDDIDYNCFFEGFYLNNYINIINDSTGDIYQQPYFTTDFIGAIREKAKLDYRLNTESEKSGIDGRNLYEFLIRDYLTTDKKYFNKISDWMSEKFEGWNLYIDIDSEPYHIRLRKGNLDIDLTESGMGISQSLPLIIRAFRPCIEKSLIIIEEPESHLHPYAHAQIAQLFAESIKQDRNKKFLIETHSQNFILRLRRLIAERFLGIDDIAIYYVDFDEEKNESNLIEIKVDELGKVSYWPEGIFSETLEETIGIRTAQIDRDNVGRD